MIRAGRGHSCTVSASAQASAAAEDRVPCGGRAAAAARLGRGAWGTGVGARGLLGGAGRCLRVREPFSWYVSWFLWTDGLSGRVSLNRSTLPANLQARILLFGRGNRRTRELRELLG